jgi:hypothetical protein
VPLLPDPALIVTPEDLAPGGASPMKPTFTATGAESASSESEEEGFFGESNRFHKFVSFVCKTALISS